MSGDRKSALDVQVGGDHYRKFKIQPIEYIQKNNLGFCEGNIVKYISRHKFKNGVEDLKKIKHYVDLLAEFEYGYGNQLRTETVSSNDFIVKELSDRVTQLSDGNCMLVQALVKIEQESSDSGAVAIAVDAIAKNMEASPEYEIPKSISDIVKEQG